MCCSTLSDLGKKLICTYICVWWYVCTYTQWNWNTSTYYGANLQIQQKKDVMSHAEHEWGINTYYNTFSLPSFVLLVAAAVMYMFTSLIHALLVSVLLVYSDTSFKMCILACVHVSNLSTQHTLEMYTPGLPCPKTLLAWSTPPTILSPRIPILRSKITLCGCWIKWARENINRINHL